jgi:hypothetical protein
MNANLTIKGSAVTINGNEISGNTYEIKTWIKAYLSGKWNAEKKVWIVDADKVEKLMSGKYPTIRIDETERKSETKTKPVSAHGNGWCNKCHSYCYGDCEAN